MKPAENIENFIKNLDLDIDIDAKADQRILKELIKEHKKSKQINSVLVEPNTRRIIMKSPITKLAVAAVIIVVVTLGLFELIDTDSKSGTVWAEVVQKVEASKGAIWRLRATGSRDPNDDWPNGYKIAWRSPAITRTDRYRYGQIYRTIYNNLDAKTMIGVLHDAKVYSKEAMSDERIQRARNDKDRWSSPQGLVNCCLIRKHHELGQKTIDGVLCEGIETTDTSGLPFKSFTGQLWIAVETRYPVLMEIEAIDNGNNRHTTTLDQFQWDVDLSTQDVEPEIPADYRSLGLEGEMKTLSEQGKKELLKVEEILTDDTIAWKIHVYKYELSDEQTKEMREPGDGMPVYSQDQFKEFKPKLVEFRQLRKAGSGEDLGTYEQIVEGRVFSFKREKYLLSDGTEFIWSVGTPKQNQ
jgi:hypothetical protein